MVAYRVATRPSRSLIPLVLLCVALSACPKAPPSLSPQGQHAWQADQIATKLIVIQREVIAANTAHILTDSQTRPFIQFCQVSGAALDHATSGTIAEVVAAYQAFKRTLSPDDAHRLAGYLLLLDVVFGVS